MKRCARTTPGRGNIRARTPRIRRRSAEAKQTDPERAGFYDSLEAALGWKWLRPEHTAATADELRRKMEEAAASGADGFKVRYLRGDAVRTIFRQAAAEAEGGRRPRVRGSICRSGMTGPCWSELSLIRARMQAAELAFVPAAAPAGDILLTVSMKPERSGESP